MTATRHLTVELVTGLVRGYVDDDCASFRGIPYAAPPVGERRWQAPAPVGSVAEVRDATVSGSPAPQRAQSFADTAALDENCLTLDVTAPAAPGSGRPVMVWLHGGGGTSGSAALYNSRHLALTGDAVVVAPNYRLGIFGYFGYPGLVDSGTFGLLDQQAALRWVRREIANFGGDPQNVTLFGESFGGQMVAAHLAAPSSAGLFHRAVLQSAFGVIGSIPAHTFIPGMPALPPRWTSNEELEQIGAATVREYGWVKPGSDPGSALAQLRQLPVQELLQATDHFIRSAYGGAALPESPEVALTAGRFHRMPVMLGTTRDEARFFVGMFAELAGNPVTAESYPRLIHEAFGRVAASEVAARYPLGRFPSPNLAWAEICTDRAWALPTWNLGRELTAYTPTWFYEFADSEAPPIVPIPGFDSGAQHSSELAYQFDFPGWSLQPPQRELAEQMNRYWTSFATYGDPATNGLPAWPDLSTGHVQRLAPGDVGATDYVAGHQLDFWAELDETAAS